MYTPELVQDYILEIVSRSAAIKSQAQGLCSRDFASDAPTNLAKVIGKICDYLNTVTGRLYASIDWTNPSNVTSNVQLLQFTDFFVRALGENVQYIDNAQTFRLPWSLIPSMKKLVKDFLPDTEMILEPQWEYNYTIQTQSVYDTLVTLLRAYQTITPDISVDELLDPLGTKNFRVVSFPSAERNNVLLHSLLGHEIGHLKAKGYFNDKREQDLLQSVRGQVAPIIDEAVKNGSISEDARPQETQAAIERITTIWQRGLEETLSDMMGCFFMGPAVLFANLEFALQDLNGLDTRPSEDTNFYPPWRMRLRNIFSTLSDLSMLPIPKQRLRSSNVFKAVNKRIELIKKVVDDQPDINEIKANDHTRIAYAEINKDVQNAKSLYKGEFKPFATSDFYQRLTHLVRRLELGIPPNAWEVSVNKRVPATMVEIINAAWFYRLSWADTIIDANGKVQLDVHEKRSRMNRLTLKALEFAFVQEKYEQDTTNKNMSLPAGSDVSEPLEK